MLRTIFLFLIISSTVKSQDPDTLLSTILRLDNDTERVNQLYTQGFDLIDKNPKLAFTYAQHCEKIAQQCYSIRHLAKSNNLMGILYFKKGNLKKATTCFEDYLTTSKTINNALGIAFAYTNLGKIYLQEKQFQKSEQYYLQALDYYNHLNNKTEVANGIINLGVVKHEQKQLDAAYENYERALQIGKELNNYEIRAICLNNLAQLFFDKGDYEKALAYNYDALELRELMGLEVDVADSHLSISEIALQQKDLELARENLNQALVLCNKHEYAEGKTTYFKLLSELYSQENNYQLAYENLKNYIRLNDSLLLLQNEDSVEDIEEIDLKATDTTQAFDSINNKPLLVLLLIIITFISYILFKNKR